jgi:dUTP pyrophosphatase
LILCDPHSAEGKTVPAGGKALIDTQLSIAVPLGTYGRVAPRSGLAAKHSIHTGAGVIDADYRGCVFVLLFNLGKEDFVGESPGVVIGGSWTGRERDDG